MRLILLGAPGAGKGTQAQALAAHYRVPHISTGEIFRQNLTQGTELGERARSYMQKGLLVPDDVTEAMVDARLGEPDAEAGFILDGFPRTVPQAKALEVMIQRRGLRLDAALLLVVPEDLLTLRLTGRRVCPQCGANYHVQFHPPKRDGWCDHCGAALVQRPDDSLETVKTRLRVYEEQTAPLIGYYRDRGLLREVDGRRPVEEVTAHVVRLLEGGND